MIVMESVHFSNTYVSRLQKKPFKPVLCPTDHWKFNDKTISIVMSHSRFVEPI